ncbi:MAG: murein transglycosylase A [Scytonematopsis contorta HA4267-MV1]|jgi:membrane-bound lytic murein transglycosylase A|nr:murein transglycosylase A [Scytonematopsis contorta HA4267-MV1]
MRKTLALLSLSLGITLIAPVLSVIAQVPDLPPIPVPVHPPDVPPQPEPTPNVEVTPPLRLVRVESSCPQLSRCLGWDEQLFWGHKGSPADRKALLASIDNSLRYLETPTAARVYSNYPIREITLDRVRRSLVRFRQLVVRSRTPAQLQAAVRREFAFYQSIGNDGRGTVKYTAYYEPVYRASRVRTAEYKYPLYSLPPDLEQWAKPHPTRLQLEGADGLLGDRSPLRGREIFWFRNRFDAYMIHIQGSAQLRLADGSKTSVGYAGATDYPWTSIGRELLKDGKVSQTDLTMPGIIRFFNRNPQEMDNYLPRWERFIFFRDKIGEPARGSIGVPVTAERSIATDKSLMPPGALALVNTRLPYPTGRGQLEYRQVNRFVLDQDTGSAIRGPGRVDYFKGTGDSAGDRAGVTGGNGTLFYLLLK